MIRPLLLVILTLLAPAAWTQTDDLAAERERLANQRIAAEARAREEQERRARLAAAERELEPASRQAAPSAAVEAPGAARTPVPSAPAAAPVPSAPAAVPVAAPRQAAEPPRDVDRMLEQIRTLGELRDAGYVTESEFELIKQRILDGTL